MATAAEVATALGGRKSGDSWMARCPCHADRTPSLSICTGHTRPVIVHCFSGCNDLDVLAELRRRGLLDLGSGGEALPRLPARFMQPDREVGTDARVGAIWSAGQPLRNTVAETYLRSRGLDLPADCKALRFTQGIRDEGGVWPALIAAISTPDLPPHAVQLTFLRPDGTSKAPKGIPRRTHGAIGSGAVWLAPLARRMLIAEGVETALSAMMLTGLPGLAALSAGNLAKVALPPQVRELLICADHDEAGQRGAEAARQRWEAAGLTVRFLVPRGVGQDFNDVLVGQVR